MYNEKRSGILEILPKVLFSKENFVFQKMMNRITKKAQTPTTAQWLNRCRLPFFMSIVGHYQVVEGPKTLDNDVDGGMCGPVYLYGVRDVYDNGPIFYFKSPFGNLPKEFWVRMVVDAYKYYEYIPWDDVSAIKDRYPSTEVALVAA